jgi:hypothetical protein
MDQLTLATKISPMTQKFTSVKEFEKHLNVHVPHFEFTGDWKTLNKHSTSSYLYCLAGLAVGGTCGDIKVKKNSILYERLLTLITTHNKMPSNLDFYTLHIYPVQKLTEREIRTYCKQKGFDVKLFSDRHITNKQYLEYANVVHNVESVDYVMQVLVQLKIKYPGFEFDKYITKHVQNLNMQVDQLEKDIKLIIPKLTNLKYDIKSKNIRKKFEKCLNKIVKLHDKNSLLKTGMWSSAAGILLGTAGTFLYHKYKK